MRNSISRVLICEDAPPCVPAGVAACIVAICAIVDSSASAAHIRYACIQEVGIENMPPHPDKTARNNPVGWHLYLLLCRDGSLYTGITTDVHRRLQEHNKGTASRYTRSRLPVKLIYQEQCPNKSSALRKEFEIKALSRKEKEKYIKLKK